MASTKSKLMANFHESRCKVGKRMHKFFNPDAFDTRQFRYLTMLGLAVTVLGELVVYILLQHSAEMGELPYYTTDALIIGVSTLEFLLCWFLGWLGSMKRRTMLVVPYSALLMCTLVALLVPGTETVQDSGLCSAEPPSSPDGISTRAAVRLSILLIFGLACAITRFVTLAHGMAYMDELSPADSTHMHLGCILLIRVLFPFVGYSLLKSYTSGSHGLQLIAIFMVSQIVLVMVYRYPIVAPGVKREHRNDTSLCSSLRRVLTNRVAMLQIIALALIAAGLWGFSLHDVDFAKVKFHMNEYAAITLGLVRMFTIIFGVVLAGYMYSGPVMPKYDMTAAVRTAILMCLLTVINYFVMTQWGNCDLGQIAGLGDEYIQPACGQSCGCDRPWMQFTPVCVNEQVTTYFSPCHAGCTMADTVNNVGVYSNCTCAPGGLVTVGPCDNGGCAEAHELHQMLFVIATLTSMLAMACQGAVVIQTVDPRDVSVAVGLASGVVSLFAFVGAHCFYAWIGFFTCAFSRDSKCLFHQESFVPWIGYSSVALAGASALFSILAFVIVKSKKQPTDEAEELTSSSRNL